MKTLTATTDLDAFMASVAGTDRSILMLDYDGTLAPFVVDREHAYPYAGVVELITQIVRSGKINTILVSGRPVESVRRLIGLSDPVEIWGGHGAEWLAVDGRIERIQFDPEIEEFIAHALAWAETEKLTERVEIKTPGIAFHWRGLDEVEAATASDKINSWWETQAPPHGLYLAEFDGGLELRVSGIDKGGVVAMVLEGAPSDCPVAYLGDDNTDEDAFAVLGERGLKVLVRPELRRSRADLWLKPPEDLLAFLQRWADSVG